MMSDIDNALMNSLKTLWGTQEKIKKKKRELQAEINKLPDGEGSGWVGIYKDVERWELENSQSIKFVQKALIAEGDEKKWLFEQIVENAIQSQKKATEKAEKAKEGKISADRKFEATKSKSGKA